MSFDAIALCEKEKRPNDPTVTWLAVKPSDLYPATIARMREVKAKDLRVPAELVGSSDPDGNPQEAARMYAAKVKRFPTAAFVWALKPRGEFADNSEDLQIRNVVLEIARKWFTRALKLKVKGRLGLHIVKDVDWKL